MLIYWLMFLTPVSIALLMRQKTSNDYKLFFIIGSIFSLLIGFRFEVGGDWDSYLFHYDMVVGIPFDEVFIGSKDYGHQLLNWVMARWDLGVYGVNIIYGSVFMIGLIKFSREQLYPWIAFSVAVPYMIIVVAMGYSRQSMALGLFMWAIPYLRKGKLKTYIFLILTAALFHKTAIILLPLGVFLFGKGKVIRIMMIIPIVIGAWDLLVSNAQANLVYQYIDREMHSSGAKIRVFMNLIPSLLLLIYRKEWKKNFDDYLFWYWISIGSIGAMGVVGFASTAVDRMALYFIPIQLVVYSRLPFLLKNQFSPATTKLLIVVGYTSVLFVWLNYAVNSKWWIPYQNILFMSLFE